MRFSGLLSVLAAFLVVLACDDSDSGGGSSGAGGVSGGSSGGSGGTSSGGAATGGSSGAGTGGSAGDCSVLSWDTCQPLDDCMLANCGTQIAACYGPNYANDDGTGSLCESVWKCSQDDCTCGDDVCLVTTCYGPAAQPCKDCIPAITDCMNANCPDELAACS